MDSRIFINGSSGISAQSVTALESGVFRSYRTNIFPALTPDYKAFIKPTALRRMSPGMKMGVSAAKMAMAEAGITCPGAVITGTGQGCKVDTEKFLEQLLEQQEQMLSPTAFMQSTHNTMAGRIALELNCKGYNNTFSQNSASLESALLDAMLLLMEGHYRDVLVGGVEELSDRITGFARLDGQVKQEEILNLELLGSLSPGTVLSEGAHCFVLSPERAENASAELLSVAVYHSMAPNQVKGVVKDFLSSHGLSTREIDLLVLGKNGDIRFDPYYDAIGTTCFSHCPQLAYKHLVGEYDCVSGYGLWLACQVLKGRPVPDLFYLSELKPDRPEYLLLYNQYLGKNHSFILLRAL